MIFLLIKNNFHIFLFSLDKGKSSKLISILFTNSSNLSGGIPLKTPRSLNNSLMNLSYLRFIVI